MDSPAVRPALTAPSLSVAVVVYRPAVPELLRTLESLTTAVRRARQEGTLGRAHLFLVDNGGDDPGGVDGALARVLESGELGASVIRGHGNVGYGRGHNLGLRRAQSDYHLVLNPDVQLDPAALAEGLRFLDREPSVGLVAPEVRGADGERQFLCRRYPDLFTLFLRGFAPAALRRRFARRLARYEMRDVLGDEVVRDIPIASGCFMLARTDSLRAVNGFSEDYFLYFEDYDLSLRLRRETAIAYVPSVRIVHLGGGAAGKGGGHVRLFLSSARRFFRTHGWKLA